MITVPGLGFESRLNLDLSLGSLWECLVVGFSLLAHRVNLFVQELLKIFSARKTSP